MRQKKLREALPIQDISGDKLLLKDGRVAIGFQIVGEEMERKTAAEITAERDVLLGSLQILPPGAELQKLDIYYHKAFVQKHEKEDGYFAQKALHHFYNRLLLQHKSYLFISLGKKQQPKPNPVNSLFSFGKALSKDPFEGLQQRLIEIERLAKEFGACLEPLGIGVKRLRSEDLQKLYYQYMSLSFDQEPSGYNRSVARDKGGISIGEKRVQVISLVGQGASADHVMQHGGVASEYAFPLTQHLQIPHVLSTSFRIEDGPKELQALDLEKRLNRSLDFLAGQDNDIKSAEIDAFTATVRQANQQLISMNLSLILWSAHPDVLSAHVDRSLSAIRMLSGAEGWVETLDTANLFFALAPGNSFQNYRRLIMQAENGLCYFSLSTNYQSEREGIQLCDRFRNPLLVRLFHTALNNQNSITVGPSGSGKSFTIGSFIIQRHEAGHRQIIIDNGGTYLNTITALKGKYYEYDPARPLSFNPFYVPENAEGKRTLSGDKLTFLISLLATLWKGGGRLSQAERSILSLMIPRFYESYTTNKAPKLIDFYLWVEEFVYRRAGEELERMSSSFDFKSFLITLKPFVEGEYRAVLHAESDEDISQFPLICFDMARIKSNGLLYPIIALLITELALDQIRAFPDSRKFIYMDEAWSMLSDSMGEFVENMYRTVRKNNGSMCIITQGITEITESAVGPAIIANADTQIILNHTDKTQVDRLGKVFGFTDHELSKITSIRIAKDYRELFIKQGDYGKVYLLEVSPHMAAVLSSKPEERNALTRLVEEKPSIEAALDQFIENKMFHTGGI